MPSVPELGSDQQQRARECSTVPADCRASGLLLHVTSLPSPSGIGDLGSSAFSWVDRLHDAGRTWWQPLSLDPNGYGNSPYLALMQFQNGRFREIGGRRFAGIGPASGIAEDSDGTIVMRTDLCAELPKIAADRVQLQQVFMNLMVNGIEAMKGSAGELTVKSQLQDGYLQFSVSDTGERLPMKKMDQIFSAFFTTKQQGSGMGLAISRSIVESYRGRLWAAANDGRGATFHFTLPTHATESSPLVA